MVTLLPGMPSPPPITWQLLLGLQGLALASASEGNLVYLLTSGQAPSVFTQDTPHASSPTGSHWGDCPFSYRPISPTISPMSPTRQGACKLLVLLIFKPAAPAQYKGQHRERPEQMDEISDVREDSFRIWNSQGACVSCQEILTGKRENKTLALSYFNCFWTQSSS